MYNKKINMKQMFISVIALAMCMTAMATETAYVQIKLTGESGGVNSLSITADDEHSSAFESGVDIERLMSLANSKSVLIYGYQGSTPCEDVVTNDLTNLQIGFTTNTVDQNYTLTFIGKTGASIKLYDTATDNVIDLDAVTKYDFSVEAGQVGQKQVLDRFVVNVPVDAGNLETCFTGTELQITNNPYYGKITVKTGAGATVKTYEYGTSSINFNETDGGGDYIYSNNTEYTVSFGTSRSFIVKVKR